MVYGNAKNRIMLAVFVGIRFTPALTPALSPVERENHSLRFEPSDVRVVVRLTANDTESATTMRIKKLFAP
jgi:hypothetical protein